MEDLNSEKNYKAGDAYAQSKLANILFTKELAIKLQGIQNFQLLQFFKQLLDRCYLHDSWQL